MSYRLPHRPDPYWYGDPSGDEHSEHEAYVTASTKRGIVTVIVFVSVVVGLVVLATTATGPKVKTVAIAPARQPAVMANALSDRRSSALTTTIAPMPLPTLVPATTTVAPATTVQTPSKGGAAGHPAVSAPSGLPPTTVGFPSTIPFPPPTPATTSTLPSTTVAKISPISVTLEIDPQSPRIGETVHFTIRATGGAWCCTPIVYFDDGSPPLFPLPVNNTPCPPPGVTPSFKIEFTHVFTTPGSVGVTAHADGFSTCFSNFTWLYGLAGKSVTVVP